MNSNLPTSWTSVSLDNVLTTLESGSRPRGGVRGISEGIPSIGGEHLTYNSSFDFSNIKYVPKSFAKKMNKGMIQVNDILIVKDGATTGKTCFVDSDFPFKEAFVNEHVFICRPSPLIEARFMFRYLVSREGQNRILENFKGSAQGGINQSFAPNTEVPLAPYNEQKRIVAQLEKLLTKVDSSQKKMIKIPLLLKRFRQSVIAAACTGRLTADWREQNPNVEPASMLFSKILSERKRKYEDECKRAKANGKRKPKNHESNERSRNQVGDLEIIPESWGYYRLEELCHLITDGTHKTPEYKDAGVGFLSVKNVRPFLVRDNEIKFISAQEHEWINSRCNPQKGDILYTKIGATFGYAATVEVDYPFSIFVSLALIKPVNSYFLTSYAEIVMNSEIVFRQARERVTGIGTPDLHLVEIRDFRIPFPPIAEQQEIIYRVETLLLLADKIEARFRKAQAHVDKLKQSILAKAFRGELVPQDPSDEPAEELLKRIKK